MLPTRLHPRHRQKELEVPYLACSSIPVDLSEVIQSDLSSLAGPSGPIKQQEWHLTLANPGTERTTISERVSAFRATPASKLSAAYAKTASIRRTSKSA